MHEESEVCTRRDMPMVHVDETYVIRPGMHGRRAVLAAGCRLTAAHTGTGEASSMLSSMSLYNVRVQRESTTLPLCTLCSDWTWAGRQQQQAECMHAQPHAFTSLPYARDVYVCKWGCIMLTRLSVHQCMHIQKSGSRKVWCKTLPACSTNVYLLLLCACLWCVEEVPELQCIRTMQRLRHTTLSRQQRAQHTAVPASRWVWELGHVNAGVP